MDIKITHIDKKAEVDGIWMDYLGVSLCVARQNNPQFLKSLKAHAAKHGKRPFHALPKDKQNAVVKQAIADSILVGWEGLIIGGEEIPYTAENAFELITNDPECLNAITTFSMDLANYVVAAEEETGEE